MVTPHFRHAILFLLRRDAAILLDVMWVMRKYGVATPGNKWFLITGMYSVSSPEPIPSDGFPMSLRACCSCRVFGSFTLTRIVNMVRAGV